MLRVLTYHRVAELDDQNLLNPRLVSATPATFDRQMRHLVKHCQVVSIEDVLKAMEKRTPLPRRAVLITFDDAYADFKRAAWHILRRYQLPVTLFVPTAYPANPTGGFWWDRLYRSIIFASRPSLEMRPFGLLQLGTAGGRRASLRRIQDYVKAIPHTEAMSLVDQICSELGERHAPFQSVLSWDELRELARDGVILGPHTRTHPILTRVPPDQAREEILGSQQDLCREVGNCLPIFCYPGGRHNDLVVGILKEEGFKLGFTTVDGQIDVKSSDPLRLARANITPRTSLLVFSLRLSRVGAHIDTWRHRT